MEVRKHRLEEKFFAHEFAAQLASGDTLTGTPSVKVIRHGADVSAQFGGLDPEIQGTQVVWTMGAGGTGEQDSGSYQLLIEVDTESGEHLVAEVLDAASNLFRRPALRVYEDADLTAP
jgi:hypothetical protein